MGGGSEPATERWQRLADQFRFLGMAKEAVSSARDNCYLAFHFFNFYRDSSDRLAPGRFGQRRSKACSRSSKNISARSRGSHRLTPNYLAPTHPRQANSH